jgi:replication initiation protein RepC
MVESFCRELEPLWQDIRDTLETFANTQNIDANESQFGRHIQNSNPDSISESKNRLTTKKEAGGNIENNANLRSLPKRDLPLGIVLDACPNLRELGVNADIRHWRDFLAAAELARPSLGISPSAWKEAREILGEQQAAITLAAIYQRSGQINNAGGYLRSLTERAREGKFSTWPMIMALLRAKLDATEAIKTAAGGITSKTDGQRTGEGNSAVIHPAASPELLKLLREPKWRR